MGCMKCGQKTEDNRLFCEDCMEDMAKCPVDPNTIVRLPYRTKAPVTKKKAIRRRRFWSPENQIELLRARVRFLTGALIVLFLCFLFAAGMVVWLLSTDGSAGFEWLDGLGL